MLFFAMGKLKTKIDMSNCWFWYRGAWHEWDIDEIDMAVPLSLDEVVLKKTCYFVQLKKDR
jgi:glucosamine-6-phosphate deaminase